MTFTIPVPLWFVVIMVVLCVAWQFAMAMQMRAMRDLYRCYRDLAQWDEPAITPRDSIVSPDPEQPT